MTDEEVNRTRSMCNPRLNKKTEHEETWHCSSLDGASEILRALLPQSKRAQLSPIGLAHNHAFFW